MATDSLRVADCNVGRGLFARRAFARGDLILVMTGSRYDRDDPIHHTDCGANLLQTGWRTYILLEPPAVFANHSCNPNAGIMDNRNLVAIRPISPGDEICFDYSTTMAENFWTMKCFCGDPACRGVITDFAKLPPEIQFLYLRTGIVQRFIASRYSRFRAPGMAPQASPGPRNTAITTDPSMARGSRPKTS